MEPNPLIYHKHLERHPDFLRAEAEAREEREVGVPYNNTIHECGQELGEPFVLDRTTFYNNICGKKVAEASAFVDDTILKEMLQYLDGARFIIRSRWSKSLSDNEDSNVSSARCKSLEQIFFCTPAMVNMARRFVSGFIMQPDASFPTRLYNIPLHCCVGMTNTNTPFPCSFSLTRTENKASFDFVFQCVTFSSPLRSSNKILIPDEATRNLLE